MHCITDDEFAAEAEEEIEEQAKQTTQTEPTMSAQPGKGKTGPKAKAKNPKSFQTKSMPPKPNRE